MITTGQMTGFVMAIVLPILVGAIPYYLFWKRSTKIEAGLLGALGYGVLGYVWEEIIYSFLGMVALTKFRGFLNATGGNAIVVAMVEALASGIFVVAGLYWGIYLTNTKQQSLYRSATIGIGFGIGYTLLTYGFQLYYAIKINQGTYTGTAGAKASLLATSTGSLYVASYRNILMVLIYMAVALLMGKYHLEKNRTSALLLPLVVYVFIRFTDVVLNMNFPVVTVRVIMCVVLSGLAAAALWIVWRWLGTGEVPRLPGEKKRQ